MPTYEMRDCPVCGERCMFIDGSSRHKCPPCYQVRFDDCPGEWNKVYAKTAALAAEDFIARNDDLSDGEIMNDIVVIVRDKDGKELRMRVYGDIVPSYWAEVDCED